MASFTVNLLLQVSCEADDEAGAHIAAFSEAAAKLESRGMSCLHVDSVVKDEPQTCYEVEVYTTIIVPASSRDEAQTTALKVVVEDIQQNIFNLTAEVTQELTDAQVPD